MNVWPGFLVASLLGATLWWSSLPAGEEAHEPGSRRPAIEALRQVAARSAAQGEDRLRSRDAMKLVLLSCFQSR